MTLLVCMYIHIPAFSFCLAVNSVGRFWETILLPAVLSISREPMGIRRKSHVTTKANYCFIIMRKNKKKFLPRQTQNSSYSVWDILSRENLSSGFSTRLDLNRSVQLMMRLARVLKFRLWQVEILYYPGSEQQRRWWDCADEQADLRLCW